MKAFLLHIPNWWPQVSTCSHMNGGIWLELIDTHLHPLPITSWRKCVLHHCANKIGIHIHLSIIKCKINACWSEDFVYIYINSKILWKSLCVNTIPWYEKNMLSKIFISNANGSANECNTWKENLLVSNEGKTWHDPFKFSTNDPSKDLFSKVISC